MGYYAEFTLKPKGSLGMTVNTINMQPHLEHSPRPNFIIERPEPKDALEWQEVKDESWRETYPNKILGITRKDILEHLEHKNNRPDRRGVDEKSIRKIGKQRQMWIARDKRKKIIGAMEIGLEKNRGHLYSLYVLKKWHGRGVGPALIAKAMRWNGKREVYLNVATYNKRAIAFYKKFGFKSGKRTPEEDVVLLCGKKIPTLVMVRGRGLADSA